MKDKLDISKINKVRKSLKDFKMVTIDKKNQWYNQAEQKQPFTSSDIRAWLNELDGYRQSINESISSIKLDLGCQPISKEELEHLKTL